VWVVRCAILHPEGVVHTSPGQRPRYDVQPLPSPHGLGAPHQHHRLGRFSGHEITHWMIVVSRSCRPVGAGVFGVFRFPGLRCACPGLSH
jgi:hypothetical protein